MCGTPQRSRSTTTSFCKPGTPIVPSSCGKGRYTNHQIRKPAAATTIATVQNRKRRMTRKMAPTHNLETVSVERAVWQVQPSRADGFIVVGVFGSSLLPLVRQTQPHRAGTAGAVTMRQGAIENTYVRSAADRCARGRRGEPLLRGGGIFARGGEVVARATARSEGRCPRADRRGPAHRRASCGLGRATWHYADEPGSWRTRRKHACGHVSSHLAANGRNASDAPGARGCACRRV